MSEINVLNIKGEEVDNIKLDPMVFDGKVNHDLIHHAVVVYLANQRKGLANTKTRGDVRGGGKKPWAQKGTGRARVGSNRSPIWRGGGVTFGPKPHSYHKNMPKKMKVAAFKSALNAKNNDSEITVVDTFNLDTHKTKSLFNVLKKLSLNAEKVRVVIERWDKNIKLSSSNIEKVSVSLAKDLNTYEVLNCKQLVFTKKSLVFLQERVKKMLQ